MPPPAPRPPDDFSDSDREWFDRLGPTPQPPAQTAAQREGDALKEAMRIYDESVAQRPDVQAALSDEARQQRMQRVLAQLADEAPVTPSPVPDRPATPPTSRPPRWWTRLRQALDRGLLGPRWPAAAALALVVAVGAVIVPVWMNDNVYERPGELKGEDDVRHVAVERPRRSAEDFAAELTRAGLKPGVFQRGKTFVVDIDIDREQLLVATPAFVRVGVPARLGFTRIEFDPRPTR